MCTLFIKRKYVGVGYSYFYSFLRRYFIFILICFRKKKLIFFLAVTTSLVQPNSTITLGLPSWQLNGPKAIIRVTQLLPHQPAWHDRSEYRDTRRLSSFFLGLYLLELPSSAPSLSPLFKSPFPFLNSKQDEGETSVQGIWPSCTVIFQNLCIYILGYVESRVSYYEASSNPKSLGPNQLRYMMLL